MNGLKVKVSDSLDNVPNENVVTQQVTDRPTNRQSDQLLELLEWLFATKKDPRSYKRVHLARDFMVGNKICTHSTLATLSVSVGL